MSTQKKTCTATRRATPIPATSGGPADETPTTGVPVLGTDAEKSLWMVLGDYPGTSAAELADATGMAGSTARRILSRWAATGVARRDRNPDNPRAADRWTAVTTDSSDTNSIGGSDCPTPTGGPSGAEFGPVGGKTAAAAPDAGADSPDPVGAQQEGSVRLAPGGVARAGGGLPARSPR
ncbi:helix-turn-helix domain-containing protein [Nocardia sp. MDA0666]|uniref:MarR family transcriptional regulator n=1 Tax=Nocardia sp. MDA0666 TaxID=2135448 RepID=UPI0011B24F8B|nr:helix-turn-helix domain-containing protein [Nocardia sp. MDA0666]